MIVKFATARRRACESSLLRTQDVSENLMLKLRRKSRIPGMKMTPGPIAKWRKIYKLNIPKSTLHKYATKFMDLRMSGTTVRSTPMGGATKRARGEVAPSAFSG